MQINHLRLHEWQPESANTREMTERLPTENFSWQTHEKSMTDGRLATHIAELLVWLSGIIKAPEFDFASVAILEAADDDTMNAVWTLRRSKQVIITLPRKKALRSYAMNHIYRHRGQLPVYLRMLNITVPGMYGPSADERKALL